MAGKNKPDSSKGTELDFKAQLWAAADKLRGHMDASEYKHVVLGLIFLKYISDSFEELHARLRTEPGADPEDRDEYLAENVFWVPQEARWSFLQGQAKQPGIGKTLDDGMSAIERDNPVLKNILPKEYARPTLDKVRLGELIDLIGGIGLGSQEQKSRDVLGRVYEYFLSQFASVEGKKGGEFYTPQSVVRVLVEMLAPYKGRIFDPCCGSGGMFVQSEKFVQAHGGRLDDISVYGQESNPTTWKLAKMNLAIRGITCDLGKENADSFQHDLHPDLKADFILANPPFNMSDWGGDRLKDDRRWKYGAPPANNANYAWIQHFIHHLAPQGTAGFVLANGSMSSNTSGEGEIRKALIEADLVDCMVALPGQLFFSTQIPVCLWFLTRSKTLKSLPPEGVPSPDSQDYLQGYPARQDNSLPGKPLGSRQGATLFIDARKLGTLTDRVHRDLTEEEIALIAETYRAWKTLKSLPPEGVSSSDSQDHLQDNLAGQPAGLPGKPLGSGFYEDLPGFCKSATLEEIRAQGYVLTPGRYVGAADLAEDDEPFDEKVARLTRELEEQFVESGKLESVIRANLARLRG
jgi:type I restriction enzyme M protein